MIQISTEVLSRFLAKNDMEIADALKDAEDDQSKVDEILSNMLEKKVGDVRSAAKKEGQGMAAKDVLSKKQTEIAEAYGIDDSSGHIEDVVQRIIKEKSTQGEQKLDAATIRATDIYKNDLKALKEAKSDLEQKNQNIVKQMEQSEVNQAIDNFVTKALEGKKVSDFSRKMFKDAVASNVRWQKDDSGEYQPFDKNEDIRVKDKMQNDLNGESYVKSLADQAFEDAKVDPNVPDFGDDEGGENSFKVPEFENREEEAEWYENLSDDEKTQFLEHVQKESASV